MPITRSLIPLLVALCLLQIFATSQPTPNAALIKNFTSSDWIAVEAAKLELESRQAQAIPDLMKVLDRDKKVELENTLDLIYPGAKKFYGHGGILDYDVDWLTVRAGWALETLTFQDFGFSEGSIREADLMKAVIARQSNVTLTDPAKTPEIKQRLRAEAVARAKAWWQNAQGSWTRFDAFLDAVKSDVPARQRLALYWIRSSKTKCDGLTVASFNERIVPEVKRLLQSPDQEVRDQAKYLLEDKDGWWWKYKHPEKPSLSQVDRVRLAEAFRLSDKLGDTIWPGWSKAPFAVLLVTSDKEFLIRHPKPSEDFTFIGHDDLLKSDVYYRERKFGTAMQATFPAVNGISTIVIGQAENTASKTSTPWVITLMHEHFHQLQDSQPNFFKDTEALNLSNGDQTGMWMINYPFPYESPLLNIQFSTVARLLVEAMQPNTHAVFSAKLAAYLEARKTLKQLLKPDDYKYLSFQLWKEGIARYTEFSVATWAATEYQPTREFRALKDFTTFKTVADQTHSGILRELATLSLKQDKRVLFYPLGAGEGILLDRANLNWRLQYFAEKFDNLNYFNAH